MSRWDGIVKTQRRPQGISHVAIQDRFHTPLYLLLGLTTDHAVLEAFATG